MATHLDWGHDARGYDDQGPEVEVKDVAQDEGHVEREEEEKDAEEQDLDVTHNVAILVGAEGQQHGLCRLVDRLY